MKVAIGLTTLLATLFALTAAVPVKRENFVELVQFLDDFTEVIPETNPSKRKPTRIESIGCYPFNADFFKDFKSDATVEKCIAYCETQDYGYAGLLSKQYCVCEDSTERYDNDALDESECSSECTGDSTQMCGGQKTLSVYDTDGPYSGCFPFEMDYLKNFGDKNSLSMCLEHCTIEGYDFAGVLNTEYCFCGNDYEKYENMESLDKSECSSPCPGDISQKCGGKEKMAYYEIEGSECADGCANNGRYQGDIVLSKQQRSALRFGKRLDHKQATGDLTMRWTHGVVLYEIPKEVLPIQDKILAAMKHISDNTCIKFFKFTDPQGQKQAGNANRIQFKKLDGCYSEIGMVGGVQQISIGDGCEYFGTIVHEIGHALGLYHEQARADRDQYVTIVLGNIEAGEAEQFAKEDTETYGVPYDVTSVMHYERTEFSKNGKDTIVAKDRSKQDAMGQRGKLSPTDIQILRIMYKCPKKCKCCVDLDRMSPRDLIVHVHAGLRVQGGLTRSCRI